MDFFFDKNGYVYIKIRKMGNIQPSDFLEKSDLRGQPHHLQTRPNHRRDKEKIPKMENLWIQEDLPTTHFYLTP